MEPSFESSLVDCGVGEDAVRVLIKQKITSRRVFFAMKEEHIVRLLECNDMAIGSHVLLWEMWERSHFGSSRASGTCLAMTTT